MKGYKCDKCGKWKEETPANEGHHEWMFADKPIYSMNVEATVILNETDSRDGQDLCLNCFLECLEMFVATCRKNKIQ